MKKEELKKEQLKLSQKVILKDNFKKIKTVAGIDQAYKDDQIVSCIVVCDYKTMKIIEKQTAEVKSPLPYIPGYLAYREMPAAVEAYNKLENKPEVIIVDGNGIMHPRRFGFASHLGLALDKPTIGVANTLVTGKVENGKIFIEKDMVGFEFKSKEHAKPLYVSPGHLISLGTALKVVSETIRPPHKLPEPLHLAHKFSKKKTQN
ncbi:endonuclease V [Nanoarchaeota archaeon]